MFPDDIKRKVENDFGIDAPAAFRDLEQFKRSFRALHKRRPANRILRCIVQVADGKQEGLQRCINIAMADWRDLIPMAEYDAEHRQILDLNMPFP